MLAWARKVVVEVEKWPDSAFLMEVELTRYAEGSCLGCVGKGRKCEWMVPRTFYLADGADVGIFDWNREDFRSVRNSRHVMSKNMDIICYVHISLLTVLIILSFPKCFLLTNWIFPRLLLKLPLLISLPCMWRRVNQWPSKTLPVFKYSPPSNLCSFQDKQPKSLHRTSEELCSYPFSHACCWPLSPTCHFVNTRTKVGHRSLLMAQCREERRILSCPSYVTILPSPDSSFLHECLADPWRICDRQPFASICAHAWPPNVCAVWGV